MTATRLAEVGDRAEFGVDWLAVEPSIIAIILCPLRILFSHKLYIDISDHVLSDILTNIDLLDLSVLSLHLHKHLLIEIVKVLLLLIVPSSDFIKGVCLTNINHWVVVAVFEDHSRGECGGVMGSRAFVSVAACSGLEEKRAVHFILFGSIDRREVLGAGQSVTVRH